MCAMRAVVDVDVNDAAFQRFRELFSSYTEALSHTKTDWKNATDEQRVANSLLESMTKRLEDAAEISHDNEEADEKRLKNLQTSEKLWSNISRSSANVAKSILDIGAGAIKLGSIAGLGLLGGSLFGIDRLAEGTSDRRREAMGLGLGIGEMRSFDINTGRAVDPNFLAMVSGMQTDPRKSWSLSTMGVNANGSTFDTSIALLKAMYARAHETPTNQLGMLSSITGLSVGTDTWRRLAGMGGGEFNKMIGASQRDASSMDPGAANALAWQNFTTQLSRAGEQIFNVFTKGLAPLAGPLEHLSSAVVGVVSRFMAGGEIKKGVDGLADSISKWSGALTKPEFIAKLELFVSDMGTLADVVHTVSDAVAHPGQAAAKAVVWDLTKGQAARWGAVKSLGSGVGDWAAQKVAAAHVSYLDSKYNLPSGMLEYIWAKESSSSMDAPDQPGVNGAGGPFQIKPSMGDGINRHSFMQSSDRAAQILAQELEHYNGDIAKALAAYNVGDPTLDKLVKKFGDDWQKHVPYLSNVRIENNTGGSVNVSVNGLAGGH